MGNISVKVSVVGLTVTVYILIYIFGEVDKHIKCPFVVMYFLIWNFKVIILKPVTVGIDNFTAADTAEKIIVG